MQAWEEHILALGRACLSDVLEGRDRAGVGTFVMASCTGYAGPTPEVLLAGEFGRSSSIAFSRSSGPRRDSTAS